MADGSVQIGGEWFHTYDAPGNAYSFVKSDDITGANVSISVEHHEVHEGEVFSLYQQAAALADGGTLVIGIQTPANRWLHLKQYEALSSASSARLDFVEGGTVNGGTVVPKNRNRTSANASGAICLGGGTVTSAGSVLESLYITGGSLNPARGFGGSKSIDAEWILNPSTRYYAMLVNNGGAAATAEIWMWWYEESSNG